MPQKGEPPYITISNEESNTLEMGLLNRIMSNKQESNILEMGLLNKIMSTVFRVKEQIR